MHDLFSVIDTCGEFQVSGKLHSYLLTSSKRVCLGASAPRYSVDEYDSKAISRIFTLRARVGELHLSGGAALICSNSFWRLGSEF